jgi:hypothetical protein
MTTNTTYIELLKLAHESLDSKDAQIAELEKKAEWLFDFALDYANAHFLAECLKALKEQDSD